MMRSTVETSARGFDKESLDFQDAQGKKHLLMLQPSRSITYSTDGKLKVSPVKSLHAEGRVLHIDGKRLMTSVCKVQLGENQSEVAALELFAKSAGVAANGPPLFVTMVSARGLRDADGLPGQGCSDPYCTCEIVGKKDTKVRTRVIMNSLTPTWNHKAVVPKYELGDKLLFKVWDKDTFSTDDFLGKAELQLDPVGELPTFEDELQLDEAGDGIKAFLRLKVLTGTEADRTKLRARRKIAEAMQQGDKNSLEAAIETAKAAGLSEVDCAAAEKALREEIQRLELLSLQERAREELAIACQKCTVAALEPAIADAKAAELDSSEPLYAEAERLLEVWRPREAARKQLSEAFQRYQDREKCPDWQVALQAAVAAAEACGLDPAETEYRSAKDLQEQVLEARRLLGEALESCDETHLRRAIEACMGIPLAPEEYSRAVQLLDAEERKRTLEAIERRKRQEAMERGRERLCEAMGVGTVEALKEALRAAEEAGLLDTDELVKQARALMMQRKVEAELVAALEKAKQFLQLYDKGKQLDLEVAIQVKERLMNAVQAARKIGWTQRQLIEHDNVRKRIHNLVEDLKGSIRVFCRVRPLSKKEKNESSEECIHPLDLTTVEAQHKVVNRQGEEVVESYPHSYDAVFLPGTQDEIFADCKELVQSALDGYNVTIFAYGQTGSGKTYTMLGVEADKGICPKAIDELYAKMDASRETCEYTIEYTLKAAIKELYCNQLVDLLVVREEDEDGEHHIPPLHIRENTKLGRFVVEDLTWEECPTAQSCHDLFDRGQRQRHTALTAMNAESSRSHLIFSMHIKSKNHITNQEMESKVVLCDLAGSERLKKSKATGEREKEAIEINKSLSALGGVIDKLSSSGHGPPMHVPYRDHQLTQVLQDSLGGTAKTLMFLNCSPAASNYDETLNTLRYGTRAKKVTNAVAKGGAASSKAAPKATISQKAKAGKESADEQQAAAARIQSQYRKRNSQRQPCEEAIAPGLRPGVSFAEQTPVERLTDLEEAALGAAGTGAILPRLAKLEEAILGAQASGALDLRLSAIAQALGRA